MLRSGPPGTGRSRQVPYPLYPPYSLFPLFPMPGPGGPVPGLLGAAAGLVPGGPGGPVPGVRGGPVCGDGGPGLGGDPAGPPPGPARRRVLAGRVGRAQPCAVGCPC